MAILQKLTGSAAPVCAILLIVYLLRTVTIYARLRHFKGPRLAGVSSFPSRIALLGQRSHEWLEDMNEKFGPITRIAPNLLITSSPELWAHMSKSRRFKRAKWFYRALRFQHGRDSVFTEVDEHKHDERRKRMMPGYSGRENLELENTIDDRVVELIKLVRSGYISTDTYIVPMDLAKKINFFTLDVISSVGLGVKFGMLQSDTDVNDYVKSTAEGLHLFQIFAALGLSWISQAPVIGKLVAPSPKDEKGFGKMMSTCFDIVDKRENDPIQKRDDMLGSFIRNGLTGADLRSAVMEQVVAGSDTTASAIRAILLHVLANPRIYNRLQQEIDVAVQDGKAPGASDGIISVAQARQLPYLQAVIREGLRIRPAVVTLFLRQVLPDGDTVVVNGEEVFIPGGTEIAYSGFAMQHNTDIYGPDAKVFRPERWFEPDEDKLATMARTTDLVFGTGRWACLGKPVAQIEIAKSIFELFRNFEMSLLDPEQPWKLANRVGLFTISDMWVQVTDRSN